MKNTVRTRIAPSPTGEDIHIGNLYTALINFAVARKNNGKFIIRIEDTDRERFIKGAEQKILSSLKLYGLSYDEGPDIGGPFTPYRQSERLPLYKKYAEELIERGKAYYCFCSKERLEKQRAQQIKEKKKPRYDKYCLVNVKDSTERIKNGEAYVIRLNVLPNKKVEFNDLIRGQITIDSNEVDDQVLLKSDGYPTYHLGVVVDDHLMEITHIIRAEEWVSSTPKHVLLYESFGWDLPIFAHVPILRNIDKSKLSKRKNPVWASWYLSKGYLPESVLNYLSLMGWSHPEGKEIFPLDEFIRVFDLKNIKPVGPVFDIVKLRWMNQQYIQNLSGEELLRRLFALYPDLERKNQTIIKSLIPLVKSRMETLSDFEKLTAHFFGEKVYILSDTKEKEITQALLEKLKTVSSWNKDEIFTVLKSVMTDFSVRMPVLYTIFTGEERGLPLPESLEILGKEKTLAKLTKLVGI